MNKNEKTNIIIQSFLSKTINDRWEELNKGEILHICKYVDYNKVPERVIADNEEIYTSVVWENVDRMKIVRLVARNSKIADLIDLSKYNYTVRETKNMLKIHPVLIDKLKIDIDKISHRDAFILLTIGREELSEKIDIRKYHFTPQESYEIIEYNYFAENIIEQINLSELKDYHICEIIKNTGEAYLNVLDLNKLTARKWVEILDVHPGLFNYCDLSKFEASDIYTSVELIGLFPEKDLNFLITNRNYKEELSALGWERIIISKPYEYIDKCCYWKLNENNWKAILEHHPDLIEYKL